MLAAMRPILFIAHKLIGSLAIATAILTTGCAQFARLADLESSESLQQAKTANNVAAATLEASIATLELLYEGEQTLVMARAAAKEGATKETVRAEVAIIRTSWEPVWKMVDETREAQSRLAALIAAGENVQALIAAARLTQLQAQMGNEMRMARERAMKGEP